MKELNDYKAEIFRRSEVKKRQIQKRRRIAVAVTVPLCLCCVFLVVIRPAVSRLTEGIFSYIKMDAMNAIGDSPEYSSTAPETFLIADPEDVARVLAVLEEQPQEDTLQKEEYDQDSATADRTEPMEYRLILEHSDGSTVCYRLQGQMAYCETTEESSYLSAAQANRLYTLVQQLAEAE